MTEPRASYVTRPILIEKLAAKLDDATIERILLCFDKIEKDTNFGTIELRIMAGKVDEIKHVITWKPCKSGYNKGNTVLSGS